MLTHDRFDGFGRLVGVVKRDRGHVVMQDMGFDNPMQELAADEAEFPVDGSCCAAGEIPSLGLIVRQRRVGMLEERDHDCA